MSGLGRPAARRLGAWRQHLPWPELKVRASTSLKYGTESRLYAMLWDRFVRRLWWMPCSRP